MYYIDLRLSHPWRIALHHGTNEPIRILDQVFDSDGRRAYPMDSQDAKTRLFAHSESL